MDLGRTRLRTTTNGALLARHKKWSQEGREKRDIFFKVVGWVPFWIVKKNLN